jgi:tetrahydromethanopterin S-methyltransferase subunit G
MWYKMNLEKLKALQSTAMEYREIIRNPRYGLISENKMNDVRKRMDEILSEINKKINAMDGGPDNVDPNPIPVEPGQTQTIPEDLRNALEGFKNQVSEFSGYVDSLGREMSLDFGFLRFIESVNESLKKLLNNSKIMSLNNQDAKTVLYYVQPYMVKYGEFYSKLGPLLTKMQAEQFLAITTNLKQIIEKSDFMKKDYSQRVRNDSMQILDSILQRLSEHIKHLSKEGGFNVRYGEKPEKMLSEKEQAEKERKIENDIKEELNLQKEAKTKIPALLEKINRVMIDEETGLRALASLRPEAFFQHPKRRAYEVWREQI